MSNPLWLPKGSIRAIIVIMVMLCVCILAGLSLPVPEDLWKVVHLVIGFYFGQKVAKVNND